MPPYPDAEVHRYFSFRRPFPPKALVITPINSQYETASTSLLLSRYVLPANSQLEASGNALSTPNSITLTG